MQTQRNVSAARRLKNLARDCGPLSFLGKKNKQRRFMSLRLRVSKTLCQHQNKFVENMTLNLTLRPADLFTASLDAEWRPLINALVLTEKHTSRDYGSQENPDVPLALCLTLDTEIQTEPFLTITYSSERETAGFLKVQVAFYLPKICEQPHFKLKIACLLISCFQTLRGVTDRRCYQQLPSCHPVPLFLPETSS